MRKLNEEDVDSEREAKYKIEEEHPSLEELSKYEGIPLSNFRFSLTKD